MPEPMPQTPQGFPPPRRLLRLGLVGGGTGLIGAVHANGARLSGRWQIAAGALSSDPERAKAAGAAWLLDPARSYGSYPAMAQAEAAREDGIDAVAIVTPNHLHLPVARAFLQAGIAVICEKPLARSLAEARELQVLQRDSGLVFALAHPYAAYAMVRQARAMVAAGTLGDLRQIHVEYFQDWALEVSDQGAATPPWRLDPAINGPSFTVADIGTHAEHLARFVSGRALQALRAEFHVTGAPKRMEDTAFMALRFEGGLPGTLMLSQAFAGAQCGLRLRIAGTRGALEWAQEEPEWLIHRPVGGPEARLSRGHGAGILPEAARFVRMPRGHPEALSDAWANLYTEVALAVEAAQAGRALPPGLVAYPDLADGLRGMAFCEAALRSDQSGGWVSLAEL